MLQVESDENDINYICPSQDELSVIVNAIQCDICNLVFSNEPRYRLHDLKVHKQQKLEKVKKKNIRYLCPIQGCLYSLNGEKYFSLHKHLKQHYLKVHAEKKFHCPECPKSFSTNSAKDAHLQTCGMRFLCECTKSFFTYEALYAHAKRHLHKIETKSLKKKLNVKIKTKFAPIFKKVPATFILPKPKCDASTQTTDDGKTKRKNNFMLKTKSFNSNKVCRQTQTNEATKEKLAKRTTETQTAEGLMRVMRIRKVERKAEDSSVMLKTQIVDSAQQMYNSESNPATNQQILSSDLSVEAIWAESRNSETQTSPEKVIFGYLEDYSGYDNNLNYSQGICRSDPMLTEKTFADKFSSIETQTEMEYSKSLFDTDSLSANFYNNTCTQTYDDILSSDLGLSDIQTQTAWCDLDETNVISTETQTKATKCHYGCTDSWFVTQTNHMETQTDLLSIFENFE